MNLSGKKLETICLMRTLFVFIAIIFSVRVSGKSKSVSSSLQLISKDFAILSRVTNAIYLQSAFLKKDLEVRIFLAELLQIGSQSFSKIVDVDIQTAIDELYRMNETMSRYPQNLIQIKDLLQSRHHIIIVKEIAEQADSFSDTMKYSMIDMLIKARNIRESFIVNNNCSRLNHTIIFAFLDLFEGTKPLPESNIISETEKILKSREYRNYKKLIDVKNIALKFTSRINDLRKLADRGLNEIKESFRFSRPAWDGNSENYNQTQIKNAFEHFLVSAEEIYKYQTIEYTPSSIHTAGFLGSKDMKKVIGDLKRPWFKKNIARGASTKNLEKALLLFRKVPQTIIDLETSWKKFVNFTSRNDNIQITIELLLDITKVSENYRSYKKILDKSSKLLSNCLNFGGIFDHEQFRIFENEQIPWKEIMTIILEINERFSRFEERYFPFISGKLVIKNLETIRKNMNWVFSLAKFQNITDETSLESMHEMRDWFKLADKNNGYLMLLRESAEWSMKLKKLKEISENLEQKQSISVKDILNKIKLIESGKCFRKDSSYFVKLQNVISSLISITLFTSNMVPQTREYLDSLSEVKNKLEIVKKEIMTVNKMRPTSDSNAVLSLTNARQISEAIGLLLTLTAIIESHGGIVLNEFPLKGYFNKNAHPYLHANLGPIFLIHDGSIDLNEYKNDPDKLYNLFTEEEFVIFLLKHEINIDTRENPIPAIKEKAMK
ncbi:hypothetical protein CRE_18419 [Caenorhabditis remanei]|uniref:Domain of unknown function WSN domain-containing protein n=1 Tax=Caenorhabditis remanei TaxID=31234 RepID=E3LK52_CAERE|nr:hypothetical protein CRE_18419 [Caenorhabditis remanei]